jgi:hypothetical protein
MLSMALRSNQTITDSHYTQMLFSSLWAFVPLGNEEMYAAALASQSEDCVIKRQTHHGQVPVLISLSHATNRMQHLLSTDVSICAISID